MAVIGVEAKGWRAVEVVGRGDGGGERDARRCETVEVVQMAEAVKAVGWWEACTCAWQWFRAPRGPPRDSIRHDLA